MLEEHPNLVAYVARGEGRPVPTRIRGAIGGVAAGAMNPPPLRARRLRISSNSGIGNAIGPSRHTIASTVNGTNRFHRAIATGFPAPVAHGGGIVRRACGSRAGPAGSRHQPPGRLIGRIFLHPDPADQDVHGAGLWFRGTRCHWHRASLPRRPRRRDIAQVEQQLGMRR